MTFVEHPAFLCNTKVINYNHYKADRIQSQIKINLGDCFMEQLRTHKINDSLFKWLCSANMAMFCYDETGMLSTLSLYSLLLMI